jgi:hypothetical protein
MGLVSVAATLTREELKRKAESLLLDKHKNKSNNSNSKDTTEPEQFEDNENNSVMRTTASVVTKKEIKRPKAESSNDSHSNETETETNCNGQGKEKATERARIRGGPKRFKLSEKAFLVTAEQEQAASDQ